MTAFGASRVTDLGEGIQGNAVFDREIEKPPFFLSYIALHSLIVMY